MPKKHPLSDPLKTHIPDTLPIHAILPELRGALRARDELVLEAPPGAGKTTVIPLSLLDEPWLAGNIILMLQPRRLAARAAAERMAELIGERAGQTVGYQIRQESKRGPKTRIVVMTEGVLTRQLQEDPALENVGMVVFDEFHERSLDSDLGLALCKQARTIFRDAPLKLLIMSATLQKLALDVYLNDAPVVSCCGKQHPVEIIYSPGQSTDEDIVYDAARCANRALRRHCGDILVFLPGRGEISRCAAALEQSRTLDVEILPLHGSLSLTEQRAAIAPLANDDRRKIVLATDIAETSLTIEGITVVIDSGLTRSPAYDPNTAVTRLKTRRISKASATQRAGRAGRLGAGTCYRLWSETQQERLADQRPAEILEADLIPLVLQLFFWGVTSPGEISWIDEPPTGPFRQGVELLTRMGALAARDGRPTITEHGKALASLPTHPRLAHMLVQTAKLGYLQIAADIAALLSERDTLGFLGADFGLRLEVVEGSRPCPPTHNAWLRRVRNQSRRFTRLCGDVAAQHQQRHRQDIDPPTARATALALAYPDRIARRVAARGRYKISNGRAATLPIDDPLLTEEWLVVVDMRGSGHQRDDRIFSAHVLSEGLFDGALKALVQTHESAEWDDNAGRFVAEKRFTIGAIAWKRRPLTAVSAQQITDALLDYIRREGLATLPWDNDIRTWQARVLLLHERDSSHPWPDVSDAKLLQNLDHWLGPYLTNVTSLRDLQKIPLGEILKNQLAWPLVQALDELAPEKIRVPSGSQIKVDYLQFPPVLAVKLQEMFGLEDTPDIANSQVKLMLHLLSPARRPLQITQDLAGFWRGAYQEVKREMRGRYPKHPWPDDPLTSRATKATKNRR